MPEQSSIKLGEQVEMTSAIPIASVIAHGVGCVYVGVPFEVSLWTTCDVCVCDTCGLSFARADGEGTMLCAIAFWAFRLGA